MDDHWLDLGLYFSDQTKYSFHRMKALKLIVPVVSYSHWLLLWTFHAGGVSGG